MAILTHGGDLTLAPTLGPMVAAAGGTVRDAVRALRAGGFTAVQLDATVAGIRPRELSPRARKDLAAVFARDSLRVAGIDLFLPRRHYLETQQLDRAMAATLAAIELAADLGRVPLSVALPAAELSGDARSAIVEAADGRGVRVAVHAEDQLDALLTWLDQIDQPALGAALDPAAMLAAKLNPVDAVQRMGKRLAVARLSDMTAGSGLRCPAGRGELDTVAYRVAVDLAAQRAGPVVLDLRGLENPLEAAGVAKLAWENASFTV